MEQIYGSLLEKAIAIAVEAHRGQIDKAGKPYILHPMRVMLSGKNEDEMIVGILHDVIEDTPISLDMLVAEGFSSTVINALSLLTHEKNISYEDYIKNISTNPLATQVKLYDLHDNQNRSRLKVITEADENRMAKYKRSEQYLLDIQKSSAKSISEIIDSAKL